MFVESSRSEIISEAVAYFKDDEFTGMQLEEHIWTFLESKELSSSSVDGVISEVSSIILDAPKKVRQLVSVRQMRCLL